MAGNKGLNPRHQSWANRQPSNPLLWVHPRHAIMKCHLLKAFQDPPLMVGLPRLLQLHLPLRQAVSPIQKQRKRPKIAK